MCCAALPRLKKIPAHCQICGFVHLTLSLEARVQTNAFMQNHKPHHPSGKLIGHGPLTCIILCQKHMFRAPESRPLKIPSLRFCVIPVFFWTYLNRVIFGFVLTWRLSLPTSPSRCPRCSCFCSTKWGQSRPGQIHPLDLVFGLAEPS